MHRKQDNHQHSPEAGGGGHAGVVAHSGCPFVHVVVVVVAPLLVLGVLAPTFRVGVGNGEIPPLLVVALQRMRGKKEKHQYVHQSIHQSIHQAIHQSTHQAIQQPIQQDTTVLVKRWTTPRCTHGVDVWPYEQVVFKGPHLDGPLQIAGFKTGLKTQHVLVDG